MKVQCYYYYFDWRVRRFVGVVQTMLINSVYESKFIDQKKEKWK